MKAWIEAHAKPLIGAVAAVAASVISLLTTLGAVHWTSAQTSLVSAETGAVLALLTALVAHFWPGTQQEPVAVAGTFTAFVSATIVLGTGFTWWHVSTQQASALVGVVTSVIGVGAALIARSQVTAARTPDVNAPGGGAPPAVAGGPPPGPSSPQPASAPTPV